MAVTILERPEGRILSTTEQTATVSESYGAGDAQFVVTTVHGLVDGDFIYAISDIEDYAGFWYVDAISTGIFKLKQYSGGTYVQFIASGSITWYKSVFTHGWSCVHLPITYRLLSNLYPSNNVDSIVTITSVTESNEYTVIHLAAPLGSVHSYDFLLLTTLYAPTVDGIYQIVEFISPTVMIINLEFDATNDLSGATALKQYNNYNILVRVYAGITSSHEWTAQKPYELAATLQLTPDSNNEVFFSINEILKSYITTRNNTLLGTLPNNIDFWTQFYIEVAESYDDSDGYSFGTYTSAFVSDQGTFEGGAVNAKLEFKNQYSGYLSEYVMINANAKFLTLFTIPVLFACSDDTPDCYQDISFLTQFSAETVIRKEFYLNGSLSTTVEDTIDIEDYGVIRVPLEADCSYDRVDITLFTEVTDDLSEVANLGLPGLPDWVYQASSDFGLTGPVLHIDDIEGFTATDFGYIPILPYTGSQEITVTGNVIIHSDVPGNRTWYLNVSLNDSGQNTVETYGGGISDTVSPVNPLTKDTIIPFSYTFAATDIAAFMGVQVIGKGGATGDYDVEIQFTGDMILSETKQFEIDCGCSNQEIRLTWLNNLGGFDYWAFTAQKDHIIEIREAIETKKNILPSWPKSYGSTADSIRKQTARVSNKAYTVRSQFLTAAEVDAISYLKSSVLVQIINSRQDRRTIIVDTDSFVKRKDGDKTYEIAFNISFTDDIPSQTV